MTATFDLTDEQRAMCLAAAQATVAAWETSDDPVIRNTNAKNMTGDGDPVEHWRVGYLAEMTIHAMLGTTPAWEANKVDPGWDGILSNGYTWDSKVARKAARVMPVPPTLPAHADIYILAKHTAKTDTVDVVGWDYWLRAQRYPVKPLKRFPDNPEKERPSHLVPRGDLRPWEDLERIHTKGIERFEVKIDGTVFPVSINHRRKAVKIGDVVYDHTAFNRLVVMGPEAARKAHMVCQEVDGELIGGGDDE